MQLTKASGITILMLSLNGCAGLDFGDQGLSYYEPKPYLFVSVNKECISTATLIALPGEKRSVKFKSGYGSADLSVSLSNGILTNAGQNTDTKIPETINSVAAIPIFSTSSGTKQFVCTPSAILYPIVNGVPDPESPVVLLVKSQVINTGLDK